MKDKWLKSETFIKSIWVSLIFSGLMLLIGSILLIIDTSYIYGALIGIGILYLSYFIIWVLWYKIPKIKTTMAKATPLLAPLIRIVIFITTLLLIAFLLGSGEGVNKFTQPVNTIMMLITYTLTLFSYGTVFIIDSILGEKEELQEIKEV